VTNSCLKVLELHANLLGSTGATVIADALRGNNSVRSLSLNDNDIGDEGTEAIASMLHGTRTPRLRGAAPG
jgi:Ran GTPase-activating protein (RanGAP) involved in mRNA processing and transport